MQSSQIESLERVNEVYGARCQCTEAGMRYSTSSPLITDRLEQNKTPVDRLETNGVRKMSCYYRYKPNFNAHTIMFPQLPQFRVGELVLLHVNSDDKWCLGTSYRP